MPIFAEVFCDQLKSVSDHLIFSFETQPWLLQQFNLRNNRKQVIVLEHRTETRGIQHFEVMAKQHYLNKEHDFYFGVLKKTKKK